MSVCRVYYVPVIPMPRHAVRQQNIGRFLKGVLSHCKRAPFSLQNMAFYSLKHGFLQRVEYQIVVKDDRNAALKYLSVIVRRAAVYVA